MLMEAFGASCPTTHCQRDRSELPGERGNNLLPADCDRPPMTCLSSDCRRLSSASSTASTRAYAIILESGGRRNVPLTHYHLFPRPKTNASLAPHSRGCGLSSGVFQDLRIRSRTHSSCFPQSNKGSRKCDVQSSSFSASISFSREGFFLDSARHFSRRLDVARERSPQESSRLDGSFASLRIATE
jgi:hypothetical protein